jgi:predicted phosphate transport protein (TIGR00153 family)
MLTWFLPKEFNFFDLFERQVQYAVDASTCFKELVLKGVVEEASLAKIQEIEHQGDEVAHEIINRLDKTFITPFDREDIHTLAKELDDVVDMITTIVNRMRVYKITESDKNLVEFADVIDKSVRALACAIKGMRSLKQTKAVSEACVDINSYENIGDDLRDRVLAEIFEKERDPIKVIKMKELYQDAETVLDICEDVAHVVGSILVKQA